MDGPNFAVPEQACDSHQHVIGDPQRYPMSPTRTYTPPEAPLRALEAMHVEMRIQRSVLIQPSFYGTDNRCLLDALGQLGRTGRGIAVIDNAVTDATLETMRAAGVRGIRLNPKHGLDDARGLLESFRHAASRVAGLGWHIQTLLPFRTVLALADGFAVLPCTIALDHFAGYVPGTDDERQLETLFQLVRQGSCYVKLSAPYYAMGPGGDYFRLEGLVQGLVQTRSDRLLWGSDWPHTNGKRPPKISPTDVNPFLKIDDLSLFDLLGTWIPDSRTRDLVLVDNPASLFSFDADAAQEGRRG
ncbi:amidohydrolase family protein (plasmid) [Lichenicola cladoniae]|uniref:Amidohydrolase family protein n=1 Tax=Lichenicola cladoniae TaxID=1484109 RepID=A0A6M8HXN5_9PROT|nr:amidohydrolase family protein [Lichenicola cladoniae]NPD68502.1 amidohydrolase family protein [Acetobacteraceae bacterium]QKE93098.1 amidohydrolase family protein [Lichenicola cladoniae]